MNAINRAGAMQADSAIWFAAPRPLPLAGLLPVLRVKFSLKGEVVDFPLDKDMVKSIIIKK